VLAMSHQPIPLMPEVLIDQSARAYADGRITLDAHERTVDRLLREDIGVLDNAVIITKGTLASRPTSVAAGNAYYATDTGQTFKYNGSAWVLAAQTPQPIRRSPTRPATPMATPMTSRAFWVANALILAAVICIVLSALIFNGVI
jgi:hypothetical protein